MHDRMLPAVSPLQALGRWNFEYLEYLGLHALQKVVCECQSVAEDGSAFPPTNCLFQYQ